MADRLTVYDPEFGRHKVRIDGHLFVTEPGVKLDDVWVSGGTEWLMGEVVDKVAELEHFLRVEVQQTALRQEDKFNPFYDGVCVGCTEAAKLGDNHMKFCQRLLEILAK